MNFEKIPLQNLEDVKKLEEQDVEEVLIKEDDLEKIIENFSEQQKKEELLNDEISKIEKEQRIEKAKKDVIKSLEMLAKSEGVELQDTDFPEVEIGDLRNSYYGPLENIIGIKEGAIDDGSAYFEEVSHFLRHLVQKRKGVPVEKEDIHVQEFFGRMGGVLGKELIKNTELEQLFFDDKCWDLKDSKTNEFVDLLIEHGKNLEKRYEKLAASNKIVRGGQKENADLVIGILERSLEQEDIDENVLFSEIEGTIESYINFIKTKKNDIVPAEEITQYASYLANLRDGLYSIRGDYWSKGDKKRIIKDNLDFFKSITSGFFTSVFVLSELELASLIMKNKELKEDIYSHLDPYSYAEQYTFEELSQKGLYSMSDKQIKRKYFKDIDRNKNFIQNFFFNLKSKTFRFLRQRKLR